MGVQFTACISKGQRVLFGSRGRAVVDTVFFHRAFSEVIVKRGIVWVTPANYKHHDMVHL